MSEKKELEGMIEKIGMVRRGNNLLVGKGATSAEVDFIRGHKQQILDLLDQMEKERNEKSQEEAEEKRKAYEPLVKLLPDFVPPESDGDEKEAKRLMAEAKSLFHYRGGESDGLNISVDAEKAKLMCEAAKHCVHQWNVHINMSYTADARKEVTRTIECEKCGWVHVDVCSDSVSGEAIWG